MSRREQINLGTRRVLGGYLVALGSPILVTLVFWPVRNSVNLSSTVLIFLLVSVITALVGSLGPALITVMVGSALLNYYFTPPVGTLAVKDPNNAITLAVFGLVALLVSWAVDVAARRTHEASRAEAQAAALAQVDRTRTALLAAVGHDLRNPLAAAKAALSTLQSQDLDLIDADRDDLHATADESLDRLTGLIENLLDMSRLQAGAPAVQLRPVEVEEVLARALDDLGSGASGVVTDLPSDPIEVEADPGLLQRVLVNLLTNAIRYFPTANPVHITTGRTDRDVKIRVSDHGPGIPLDQRQNVFLPFQRLGDTDNTTGVGLGLALAKGLTEAMQGSLAVEDTPGGGVTMVVRLRPGKARDTTPQPGQRERAERGAPGEGR